MKSEKSYTVAEPSYANLLQRIDDLERKLGQLKQCKEALKNITSESSAQLGEKFFQAIVKQLAEIFKADYTFIGRICDQHHRCVMTISRCVDGKIADNIEYDLANTPCENVVGQQACVYPSHVAHKFPQDALLSAMKVQGYVGVPLFDSGKQPLGIMAVLFRSPIDDAEFIKSILQIYATGTAAEIERMHTEKALKESEARYQLLAENTTDIIMRFDREGRHLYVNSFVSKVIPMIPDNLTGRTHRELGFPEDQCLFWEKKLKAVINRRQPHESDFDFEGPRGTISFNWRLIPEFDDSGEVVSVLSIARDVTEQKKTERKYRTLFNQMQEGFSLHEMVYDADGKAVDYRFLSVNPAFEKLTGLSGESIIGKTVLEVLPNTEPYWIEAGGHVVKTGEPCRFENFSREMGKHFEVLLFRPQQGQFACIFHDITDRKHTMEALKQSEEKFSKLFETSPIWTTLTTLGEGLFLEANQAFLEDTGFRKEEVIGHKVTETGLWIDPAERQSVVRLLEKNKRMHDYPIKFRMKNGEIRNFLWSAEVLVFEGVQCILNAVRDITDLKKTEDQLRKSIEALSRREKELSEKSHTLAEVNQALKAMLDHREVEKRSVEESMLANLRKLVFPYVEKMAGRGLDDESRTYLNLIKSNLEELVAPLSRSLSSKYMDLTPAEIEVADLLRQGKTSKEIAALLCVSTSSVSFHRYNIRKKFGLLNKRTNLISYLKALPN